MVKSAASSSRKQNKNTSKSRSGSYLWLVFAIAFAIMAAIAIFLVLSQVTSTTSYWVLGEDVEARDRITEDMVVEVVTSTNTEPPNALGISSFQSSVPVFARYSLSAGDILTPSNVGLYDPIQTGIPDDFTVMSFSVPAANAAAGRINRGTYIDLITTGATVAEDMESGAPESQGAQYVLRNVLVLDAAADLSAVDAAEAQDSVVDAPESPAVRAGIPTLYTVALSQEDAVRLAAVLHTELHAVIAPINYEDAENIPEDPYYLDPMVVFGPDAVIPNSGEGTDSTFGLSEEEGGDEQGSSESNGESTTDQEDADDTTTEEDDTTVSEEDSTEQNEDEEVTDEEE